MSIVGKSLVGWKTTIDGEAEYIPGHTMDLEDLREDFAIENGEVFEIYLYAEWEIGRYSIKFETYDSNGNIITYYGTKHGTLTTTATEEEYDDVTIVNYEFSATAETCVLDGQKYRFANK